MFEKQIFIMLVAAFFFCNAMDQNRATFTNDPYGMKLFDRSPTPSPTPTFQNLNSNRRDDLLNKIKEIITSMQSILEEMKKFQKTHRTSCRSIATQTTQQKDNKRSLSIETQTEPFDI